MLRPALSSALFLVLSAATAACAVGLPLPTLVADTAPDPSKYPDPARLPATEIESKRWSWVTGQTRAQSLFAGHVTGTTICDLRGAEPVVQQAEIDKVKGIFRTMWKEPTAPPVAGAPLLVPPAPTAPPTPLTSFSFDCGKVPHFTTNGISIKPDFVLEVWDAEGDFMITLEAVSLQDGNVLGFGISFKRDAAMVIAPTPGGQGSVNSIFAMNIKPYLRGPVGMAYLEGTLGAVGTATFLVEKDSSPPQGIFLDPSLTLGNAGIARFIVK